MNKSTSDAMTASSLKYIGRDMIAYPVLNLLGKRTDSLLTGEVLKCSDYICQYYNFGTDEIKQAIETHAINAEYLDYGRFMCSMHDNFLDLDHSLLESPNSYSFVYINSNGVLFTITVAMKMLGDTSANPTKVHSISIYASSHNQHV